MTHHLPPPPRPGQTRRFHPPHDPAVRVLHDGTWQEGRLHALHTDADGTVHAEVTHLDAVGATCHRTVLGHEVREPAAPAPGPAVGPAVGPADPARDAAFA